MRFQSFEIDEGGATTTGPMTYAETAKYMAKLGFYRGQDYWTKKERTRISAEMMTSTPGTVIVTPLGWLVRIEDMA